MRAVRGRLSGRGGAGAVEGGTGYGTGGGDGRDTQWFMHDKEFYARHPGERETRCPIFTLPRGRYDGTWRAVPFSCG
ncbi:hypothetical protein GCM10010321_68460 [Streptomyces chartreusis]|nr:hypothetical protein GCM10010321_68460 [Streptomyces chartreusis]